MVDVQDILRHAVHQADLPVVRLLFQCQITRFSLMYNFRISHVKGQQERLVIYFKEIETIVFQYPDIVLVECPDILLLFSRKHTSIIEVKRLFDLFREIVFRRYPHPVAAEVIP